MAQFIQLTAGAIPTVVRFLRLDYSFLLSNLVFLGLPTDAIQIKSIQVSPDPPQPGKDLTVTVNGEAVEQIEVRSGNMLSRAVVSLAFRMARMPMSS